MAHMVFCTKYKAEMEGLDEPPFDTDFGQKIYKNVSKQAWGEWVERQKMLLNEYRLQPWTREAQEFLVEQMNEFFFGAGGELPKSMSRLRSKSAESRCVSRVFSLVSGYAMHPSPVSSRTSPGMRSPSGWCRLRVPQLLAL